jgi:hypothetical protein
MSELWYVRDEGREMGPMGFLFLKILAEEGKITPETPVRRENGPWTTAGQVEGVFGGPPVATPARSAPRPIRREIDTPSLPGQGGARWLAWVAIVILVGFLRIGCRSDHSTYTPPRFTPPPVQPWPDEHVRKLLDDIERQKQMPFPEAGPEDNPEMRKARERFREAINRQLKGIEEKNRGKEDDPDEK